MVDVVVISPLQYAEQKPVMPQQIFAYSTGQALVNTLTAEGFSETRPIMRFLFFFVLFF